VWEEGYFLFDEGGWDLGIASDGGLVDISVAGEGDSFVVFDFTGDGVDEG